MIVITVARRLVTDDLGLFYAVNVVFEVAISRNRDFIENVVQIIGLLVDIDDLSVAQIPIFVLWVARVHFCYLWLAVQKVILEKFDLIIGQLHAGNAVAG